MPASTRVVLLEEAGMKALEAFVASAQGQMPFIQSLALNKVAAQARLDLNAALPRELDGISRFTEKAFLYNRSTKARLVAEVGVQESRKYLAPLVQGGSRPFKKAEGYLKGIGGPGGFDRSREIAPVKKGRTRAGNISRGALRKVEAGLSTTAQYGGVFIGTPRGLYKGQTRAAGAWMRLGRKWDKRKHKHVGTLVPLFKEAADRATYRPNTFPMMRLADESSTRSWPAAFSAALEQALRTAR